MNKYLVGIDLGTSSCKTVLFDSNGRIAASASQEYDTYYGGVGEVEQDPADWWRALCATSKKILDESGIEPTQIAGIGIDAQSSSFIPMDAKGQLLSRALIWTDRRAIAQQHYLEENVNIDVQTSVNGNIFDASNVGTKYLWWKQTHPDKYVMTSIILNAGGYLVYKLTGKYSCSEGEADLSQLSDQGNGDWSETLLNLYDLDKSKLPPIYDGISAVGQVTTEASKLTGFAAGTPVTVGAMDVCATALGGYVYRNGDAVITGGTVTGIALCADKFVIQRTSHVYRHIIPGRWIYCASIDFGGGSLRWFRDRFMTELEGSKAYNIMDAMAEGVSAGSERLVFMPYMTGQRCPEWDNNMTGVFFGLQPKHGKAHCIRAIMEGTAYGLRKIENLFAADGLKIKNLIVAGGCGKSRVWMDIFSQVLEKDELYKSVSGELAALGSAISAGLASNVWNSVEEAAKCCALEKQSYGSHDRELYKQMSGLFENLYPAVKDSFRRLREIK